MKNICLTLIALGTLTMVGCKKDLELYPTDNLNPNNTFVSVIDLQKGVNGAYGAMTNRINKIYVSALLSDEAALGDDNSGQGALTYRYQFSADQTTGGDVNSIYGGFGVIDRINRVLDALPGVTANGAAEEALKVSLEGQLKALRAISSFEILEAYSGNYNASGLGIAYPKVSDPMARPARLTMGETAAEIEADFAAAATALGSMNASSFNDTVINAINLAHYRARFALYKGDYTAAIDYATQVINSNARTIATADEFPYIWVDADPNIEVLFRTRLLTSNALGGLFTTTSGLVYIRPSNKLINQFSNDDVRLNTYFGLINGKLFVKKYEGSDRGGTIVDLKHARIAETYLIRAEAYARSASPNLASGSADLNALRTARMTGYTPQTYTTAAALLDEILNERFKELCFEGFRYWDLRRFGQGVSRDAQDAEASWRTLDAGSFRFVLPIPQAAILANPNTTQNPGY